MTVAGTTRREGPECSPRHLRGARRRLVLVGLACPILVLAMSTSPSMIVSEEAVRGLLRDGRYAEAESLASRHLVEVRIREGERSAAYLSALDLSVKAAFKNGRRSQELLERARTAVTLREALLGPDDPRLVPSLQNLALVGKAITGDDREAVHLLGRAHELLVVAEGSGHPDTLDNLVALAEIHRRLGRLDEARAILEPLLPLLSQETDREPRLVYSRALQQMAEVCRKQDRLHEGLPLAQEAVRIQEEILGPMHPELAVTINRLAVQHWALGEYVEARALYERKLEIETRALRPDHEAFGTSWLNLGILLWDMGDPLGAKHYFDLSRALPVHRETADRPGRGYPTYAALAIELGDYDEARRILEHQVKRGEELWPPTHPSLIEAYWKLGVLFRETGDWEAARETLQVALQRAAGTRTRYAEVVQDLALLEEAVGDLPVAAVRQREAVAVFESTLGREHPLTADARARLARLMVLSGQVPEALDLALEAAAAQRRHLWRVAPAFTERQVRVVEDRRMDALAAALLALEQAKPAARVSAGRRVWDEVIRGRALFLDEMAARHGTAIDAESAVILALRRLLAAEHRSLARCLMNGPGSGDPAEYVRRTREKSEKVERIERELAKESAAFREEQAQREVGLEQVRSALAPVVALVGFVKREEWHGHPPGTAREEGGSYLAFVMYRGSPEVVSVPLGAAAEMDRDIEAWQLEAGRRPRSEEDLDRYRAAGERLRRRLWDPITEHLGDAEQILLVPDGAIHLVNFATLPDGRGGYLLESERSLHYLSSERDILRWKQDVERGEGLLALGDADFDEAADARVIVADAGSRPTEHVFRGQVPACAEFRDRTFARLPGSGAEAEEIALLWSGHAEDGDALVLTGEGANEVSLKRSAAGRRVIHLATHAFLLGSACDPLPAERAQHAARLPQGNPLILNGLALAGANRHGEADPEGEDGVLTSEEAASLDLRAAEWVVLSACNTGVGDIRAGEGVFGLRRAFQIAGARTLILSLWPVEDQAARQWFRNLYPARLEGASTPEAMRRASLEILERQRTAGMSTHPFVWGAFVAAGDWR